MLDLLVSASVIVPSLDQAVAAVVDGLDFPPPKPTWILGGPGFGFEVAFCRVHPSMAMAPTRLELMCPRPPDEPLIPELPRFYVREVVALQGRRPIRTHATVTASSRLPDLLDRLRRAGVRHRIDPPIPEHPFSRLWLGVTEGDPAGYRPDEDAGLFLEVVETETLRLAPETFQALVLPVDLSQGAMIRIVSRGYLVRDLERSVATLATNLGWEPVAPIEQVAHEGYRRAQFGFEIGHSATLDLIEPTGDGPAGSFMSAWGPGPYSVRIAVNGLDARAELLKERRVPFSIEERWPLLRVDPTETLGTVIEFVGAGV